MLPREAGLRAHVWIFVSKAPPVQHQTQKMGSSPSDLKNPEIHGFAQGTEGYPGVLRSRRGKTLRRQTILKCDHFPSCRNHALKEQLSRAPNFRQVEELNVFGVGQPEVHGVSDVCRACIDRGFKRVLWFNLREEPFIYINGVPFCVKNRKTPFGNVENTGVLTDEVRGPRSREARPPSCAIDRALPSPPPVARVQLLSSEERLKADVLEEAQRYGNKILLHGERLPEADSSVAAWGEVYSYWEEVTEDSVRCVHEVFHELEEQGVPVEFARVPITDENPPEEQDFDVLVDLLARADPDTAIIFNCQLGRGRTTTGMTIACMMASWVSPRPTCASGAVAPAPAVEGAEDAHFDAVDQLVARLGGGLECQRLADAAIDACGHMQNLRSAIVLKRSRARSLVARAREQRALLQHPDGAVELAEIGRLYIKEQKEEESGLLYLERYLYVILLAEYFRVFSAGTGDGALSRPNEPARVSHSPSAPIPPSAPRRYAAVPPLVLAVAHEPPGSRSVLRLVGPNGAPVMPRARAPAPDYPPEGPSPRLFAVPGQPARGCSLSL